MTNFPDFWAALAAPFEGDEVKKRRGTGGDFHYITARTAQNRLDNVCGPEGWWDDYAASERSVVCRLTIRLPDGTTITKCDAGGYAGMSDEGDDSKSGYSDAFKRAAVKFGIARFLYQDGVPEFAQGASGLRGPACPAPAKAIAQPQKEFRHGAEISTSTKPNETAPTSAPKKADARSCWQLVLDATSRRNDTHHESISPSDTHWMLYVMAEQAGKVVTLTENHSEASIKVMETLHANSPTFVIQALIDFVARKITPHKVTNLFLFERDEFPFDMNIPIVEFVHFETTDSGRGNFGEAMSMMEMKAQEQRKPSPHRQWMEPDGRNWIMDQLRSYISAHPCMLPPITGVPQ